MTMKAAIGRIVNKYLYFVRAARTRLADVHRRRNLVGRRTREIGQPGAPDPRLPRRFGVPRQVPEGLAEGSAGRITSVRIRRERPREHRAEERIEDRLVRSG